MNQARDGQTRSDRWTDLMLQARDGDRAAFDRLLDEARPSLRARAMARLQDAPAADEAATRTFVRAWKHRENYDPARANAATWLYRIIDHLITDQGRTRQRQRDREVSGFESVASMGDDGDVAVRVEPEDDVELPATAEADQPRSEGLLKRAMAQLSEADQNVLGLFYFEELSYEAMALRLGIRPTAVGPRLTRARQRLLEKLPPECV